MAFLCLCNSTKGSTTKYTKNPQRAQRFLSVLCDSFVFLVFKKDTRLQFFFFSILLCLFLPTNNLYSQIERETRAVWLTTNHRLDWPPPTYSADKQKQALVDILDDIKSKNLNTVYFQVRSNGTVMFNSSFEPFNEYLTGKIDATPSYDPLKFAVEQAHKRGLEIHAWINAIKVFEGKDSSAIKEPNHICVRKPEWIIEDIRDGQKSYWCDPGLPEVRSYIADMITELVENYDVDGIHLDYIRYPGKNFDDDFSYRLYGQGQNKDDWRRANITSLVEEIYKKVKSVNKFVKVGAAPIGIYKNFQSIKGWESYYELYQDSYGWMKKGIVDYLTPQTYWGLNENPRFDILAKDWKQNSNGRNIVLGIAAYKENVKDEVNDLINYARSIKTAGVSFFRYEHIKNLPLHSFDYKVFPASMPWLDGIYPQPPVNLSCVQDNNNKNTFTLRWQTEAAHADTDSASYFSIYNLPKRSSAPLTEYLFDVLLAPRSSVRLSIEDPKRVNYNFALKSVNKLWNESDKTSNVVSIQIPVMKNILALDNEKVKPFMIMNEEKEPTIFLNSDVQDQINVYGMQGDTQITFGKFEIINGENIISIDKDVSKLNRIRITWLNSKMEVELNL